LTISQLQELSLNAQGLRNRSTFGVGKQAVLDTIEQLGYLQIDSLSVVERAHHHTLWSRIPDYHVNYLEELVKERKVFEYWFHAASYLPIKDFRFALPQMMAVKQDMSHYYNPDPNVMQYVIDTIRNEGPKRARDFENASKKAGSWWKWKPTKIALERLFLQGDIMIVERIGMQKTFDLTERVLPVHIDLTIPSPIAYAEYLVNTYLRAYGFTTIKQITHLKSDNTIRKNVIQVLGNMIEEGIIKQIAITGLPTVYVKNDSWEEEIDTTDNRLRIYLRLTILLFIETA